MLETRTPPTSNRTRRLDALPRSGSRPAGTARSAIGNTALDTFAERPAPRPVATPRSTRMGRSEMRLMGLATTCTAIVCGLLLLYLAAYAHVSQLGYDQAEARQQLRHNQLRNESLRAERDRLQSRQHVIARAIALGMTPRGETPITYITARRSGQEGPQTGLKAKTGWNGNMGTASDGEQETNGGTTAGSDAQPSFDH